MIDKLDSNRLNELSEYFILDYLRQQGMVLTGTGDYACRRPDGVLVVPIGCLKH